MQGLLVSLSERYLQLTLEVFFNYGGQIGRISVDSKSTQPGATPGLPANKEKKMIKNNKEQKEKTKKKKKQYYPKQVSFFWLLQKIKLWPSRQGILHSIKSFVILGNYGKITTHCNQKLIVRNSKRSRAARWLRNKWFFEKCPKCRIPGWKIEKFHSTFFTKYQKS